MGRFQMWLQRLLYGRYGNDELNRFLLVVCLICIALGFFRGGNGLRLVIVGLLIIIYCRMFSRSIQNRSRENQKYLELTARFRKGNSREGSYRSGTGYGTASSWTVRPQRDKDHKILRCPGCGAKLRVPKGVGKISITCPHCSMQFIKKV